ncbi:MAG: hypothetical protein P9M03_05975 [Candidatus Theseobacter exili]|nr:hypothetical protein [Candidatus Theseobacter exili]
MGSTDGTPLITSASSLNALIAHTSALEYFTEYIETVISKAL